MAETTIEITKEPKVMPDGQKYFDLEDVIHHVKEYFKNSDSLKNYTVLLVRPKSVAPDDFYLFQVIAKKANGTYACWTTWNEWFEGLHHGHYDLTYYKDAVDILNEYANY